ncbi:type I-E CRISPR-associated protein Cas5/CasD [Streptomyces profundus]|uniref:type I-E CRISPR-associated protein Cas5/CasD n=1 Tax=Streptomyces profundus TaxID=2867410 RepID=UPI001D16B5EC|nr:type I-E CRISPR-associated protein Cas5/CasD [Streptomyces sp. MA3_2.13]UED84714.1 type I-E CRISPR-associated protein Cas5/CasD [Streptomyces sp. MA3_2.13]
MTSSKAEGRPGLLLRLAGPLQSWGEKSHFTDRDTARFPTRSGVIGMLAAALGRKRGEPLDDLTALSLTVREDRPGVMMTDLHTVGGGLPNRDTVTTAEGKKRGGATATLLSRRAYLADAVFTAALTSTPGGPDAEALSRYAEALREPRWPFYLGRRSCPPEGPVLLAQSERPLEELVRLPVSAERVRGAGPLNLVFLSDQPLDVLPVPDEWASSPADESARPTSTINDDPRSFHPKRRTYRVRPLYRRTVAVPEERFAGLGAPYLVVLEKHLAEYRAPSEEGVTP